MSSLERLDCVAAGDYTFAAVSCDQRVSKFLLTPSTNDLCNLPLTDLVIFRLEIIGSGGRDNRSVMGRIGFYLAENGISCIREALQNEIPILPLGDCCKTQDIILDAGLRFGLHQDADGHPFLHAFH